jgi:Uma2 family endonuclease
MAIDAAPAVEVRKKLTPDDVWEMKCRGEIDPDLHWELIEGELVEIPPESMGNAGVGATIVVALGIFAREHGGKVFGASLGTAVGAERRQLREVDAAYVTADRLQASPGPWMNGAPDLVVEVLSRGQYGPAYARGKVREYIEAGAQLVWLVDARREEVRVYRPNSDEFTIYRNDAVLTLEPIAGGFELKVSDIFR